MPLEQHSTYSAVWAFEIPLRKFWWCLEIGFVVLLILCNCRLPLSASFSIHVCLAPLALHPEVFVQWAGSAGCSGCKPDLQYKLNSFQSALWLHRHPRAESDGNAWWWWESRSSQQQVVIRAGRSAGKTSLLIAWHMCPFPSGTAASSSGPPKDFVPWNQASCKTQILTWCCKWNQALNSAPSFRQEFCVGVWLLFRAAQQATTIFFSAVLSLHSQDIYVILRWILHFLILKQTYAHE